MLGGECSAGTPAPLSTRERRAHPMVRVEAPAASSPAHTCAARTPRARYTQNFSLVRMGPGEDLQQIAEIGEKVSHEWTHVVGTE